MKMVLVTARPNFPNFRNLTARIRLQPKVKQESNNHGTPSRNSLFRGIYNEQLGSEPVKRGHLLLEVQTSTVQRR